MIYEPKCDIKSKQLQNQITLYIKLSPFSTISLACEISLVIFLKETGAAKIHATDTT